MLVASRVDAGNIARALLGERFHSVARLYRAVFVDLDAVASVLSEALPLNSTVLDVGGGDGAPLNYLLSKRRDLKIVMMDIASSIGGAIDPRYAAQVRRFPGIELETYDGPPPDSVLVMDVIHHIPEPERPRFFRDLARVARRYDVARVVVKDVEPGHIRSFLGLVADRYISGDKNVRLMPLALLTERLGDVFGAPYAVSETRLRGVDPPNYCVVISQSQSDGRPSC